MKSIDYLQLFLKILLIDFHPRRVQVAFHLVKRGTGNLEDTSESYVFPVDSSKFLTIGINKYNW